MLRRALLLKVVSWLVLSPAYAVAQQPQLHCRPEVREAMTRAWIVAEDGHATFEAMFLVRADGSIDFRGTTREYLTMHVGSVPEDTIALFHTHPNQGVAELSAADRAVADRYGLVIYAITNRGLYQYSHPRGAKMIRPNMEWSKACQ